MQKTLKDFFEVYKPTVKGEKRFVDKHVVVKHKDRNGNGDDVFNATNVKSVDKSPEHGYNAGEDSAVYEQVLEETFKIKKPKEISKKEYDKLRAQHTHAGGPGKKRNYANEIYVRKLEDGDYADQHFSHADYGIPTVEKHRKSGKHYKFVHESVEQIDELSTAAIKRYKGAALDNLNYHSKQWDRLAKLHSFTLGQEKAFKKHDDEAEKRYNGIRKANKRLGLPGHNLKEEILDELSKSTLGKYIKASSAAAVNHSMFDFPTALHQTINSVHMHKPVAERKKLHAAVMDIVKKKNRPGVKEEVEQIDELSKKTLGSYVNKASDDNFDNGAFAVSAHKRGDDKAADYFHNQGFKRRQGIKKATARLTKEGLEAIELGINEYFAVLGEEIDQETFDSIVEDVATALVADLTEAEEGSVLEFNNKDNKKSKADIIESVVDKYAPEVEYNELTEEEYVIDCLSKHVNEKIIAKVLDLYDMLDEENKEELLDLIETREGINEVLNFIIEDKTSEEE